MTAVLSPILFGTAGHVDHGKSTLIRALTGIDPDRYEEEQRRGLTIDLGYSYLLLKSDEGELETGFVDVPGHESFVKNMVVGAVGIDAVLLVVAADEGVMQQTKEHVAVCDLLGARGGLVALSKIDLVDEEMIELAVDDVRSELEGTFLEDANILPVSAQTGAGLDALVEELARLSATIPPRPADGPYRYPIHRVFSRQGQGTVVTGVPMTGTAHIGDTLEVVERRGKKGTIRSIQAYYSSVESSRPGHTAGLNLRGLTANDVGRGLTLATPGVFEAAKLADVHVRWIDVAPPLKNGMQCFCHLGSAQLGVTLHVLGADVLKPGEVGYLQLEFAEPACIVPGDRYLLRLPSPPGTVGGGIVLGASPGQRRRRRLKAYTLEEVERRHKALLASPEDHLADLCRAASGEGLALKDLATGLGVLPDRAKEIAESAIEKGLAGFDRRSKRYFSTATLIGARDQLLEVLGEFHKTDPHRVGMTHAVVVAALAVVPDAARELLAESVKDGAVQESSRADGETVYALPGFEPALDKKLAPAAEAFEKLLHDKPYDTPDREDCPRLLKVKPDAFTRIVEHLRDRNRLLVLDGGYYHTDAVEQASKTLIDAIEQNGPTGLATLRDLLNTSRKHAQRIIDYLTLIGHVEHAEGNLRRLPTKKKR